MKLSYKKYPALLFADIDNMKRFHGLQTPDYYLNEMRKYDKDSEEYRLLLSESYIYSGCMLHKPIFFATNTFCNAVDANQYKLAELGNDNKSLIIECLEDCIIVILQSVHILHHIDDSNVLYIRQNVDLGIVHCALYNKKIDKISVIFTTDKENIIQSFTVIEMILLFKKYASVDLEFIEPGKKKKIKDKESGKVFNEMGIEAIMLDSTWFREIIRKEGFKVRGHFRLQPCKNEKGEWTRKIIYIEEFEKHGYHRHAKIN